MDPISAMAASWIARSSATAAQSTVRINGNLTIRAPVSSQGGAAVAPHERMNLCWYSDGGSLTLASMRSAVMSTLSSAMPNTSQMLRMWSKLAVSSRASRKFSAQNMARCGSPLRDFDAARNPYVRGAEDLVPDVHLPVKVGFEEKRHKYYLGDDRGTYGKYIIGASSWLKYCKAAAKPYSGKDRLAYLSEQASKGGGMSAARFNAAPAVVRRVFTEYLNGFSGAGAVGYAERRAAMLAICDKDYTYFAASRIFECLENFLARGSLVEFDDVAATRLFLSFLGGAADPEYGDVRDPELRGVLVRMGHGLELFVPTGNTVVACYRLPNAAGTALHEYLEARLTGGDLVTKLHEPEDYRQVDSLVRWALEEEVEFYELEGRYGSYRHLACGTSDAVVRLADGALQIWDWKRVNKWLDDGWFMEPAGDTVPVVSSDHALGSKLVEYIVQLAVYRKLVLLQGTEQEAIEVSDIAYLVVFHPAMQSWRRLEIDLAAPLKADARGSWGYGSAPFSPIEFVDWSFADREALLKKELLPHAEAGKRQKVVDVVAVVLLPGAQARRDADAVSE